MSVSYPQYPNSSFPESVDNWERQQDLTTRELPLVRQYQEYINSGNMVLAQQILEHNPQLKVKIFSADRMNNILDGVKATQKFFKDNVDGYVTAKQVEMNTFVERKVTEVNNTVTNGIATMESKKNYFTTFVNTKEDEVRALVQEFDSNTARYYTTWIATNKQTEFNIFSGSNTTLPPEANLNISVENIDLIINGVMQTPTTDYTILNNGLFNTIKLSSNAANLIQAGTEVVVKWYKNVGKLYFKHSSSHGEGGSDQLIVTTGMLDSIIKERMKYIPITNNVAPNPLENKIWIDTSM